ncbi:MAG TPA: acylphosphatase [Chloroflexota bacterium]|nr:acylphosphatase [Chloroflexota bacterium]
MRTRVHVFVSGLVQGVNFRMATRREAEMRGVTGWVANAADGRVEAVFEGEAPDVQRLVDWCHHGPSRARVDRVEVQTEPYVGEFDSFDIIHGPGW